MLGTLFKSAQKWLARDIIYHCKALQMGDIRSCRRFTSNFFKISTIEMLQLALI